MFLLFVLNNTNYIHQINSINTSSIIKPGEPVKAIRQSMFLQVEINQPALIRKLSTAFVVALYLSGFFSSVTGVLATIDLYFSPLLII
jgi:hypothetical protein